MADWEEVVRRMEESTERIKKAHADKQAKRITIQKVGKGRYVHVEQTGKYYVPYSEPHGVIRIIK